MKYFLLTLYTFCFLMAQSNSPCEDSKYLELKKKKLDDMSDREYYYFSKKDTECNEYNNASNIEKSTNKDELTEEQSQAFNRKKLSVENYMTTTMGQGLFGEATATSVNKWKAYKGFNEPITELEFFTIAGYKSEAKQVEEYMAKATQDFIYGGIGYLVGFGMMMYSTSETVCDEYVYIDDYCYEEYETPLLWPGAAVLGVGTFFAYSGYLKLTNNWAAYATVNQIADDYNRDLKITIKREF